MELSKKNRCIILGAILLLLIVPSVLSQPFQTNVNQDTGLEIEYNKLDKYKQNEELIFSFHLFNKSDGLSISNDIASCSFHLYNSNGVEILDNHTLHKSSNKEDFHFFLNNSYTKDIQRYSYLTSCNTSSIGGFISFSLEITKDGKIYESVPYGTGLGIILIGVIFFILYLANSLSEEHALLKLFLSSICVFLIAPIIWIARIIADFYSTSIANLIYLIFWAYTIIIFVFAFYLFVAFLIWLVKVVLKIDFTTDVEKDEE